MAEMEKVEFEFPDEASENPRKGGAVVKAQDDEIEIIDDTPEQDRNRKPMEEPPKEFEEDEIAKYDESVQKRIKHFTKGYHEERRAKEAAEREREAAVNFAKTLAEENKNLKGSLHQGQSALLEQAKKVVANEMEQAKRKFKEAYESGDSDALTAAQEEMTMVKMKAERVNNFKPAPLPEEKPVVQPQQVQAQEAPVDPKLKSWLSENDWYGSNKRMTAYALGMHEDLVTEGVKAGSDDYYKRINDEMRVRFPDVFESGKSEDAPPPRTQKSSVVAPATRSTAPRKVVLTKSQVEIAKRLGVPLELYARKVADDWLKVQLSCKRCGARGDACTSRGAMNEGVSASARASACK